MKTFLKMWFLSISLLLSTLSACVIVGRAPQRTSCRDGDAVECSSFCDPDGYCEDRCVSTCSASYTRDPAVIAPARSGDIELAWRFDTALSCAQAEVDSIELSVEGLDSPDFLTVLLPCNDRGALLTDFAAGTYRVQLDGLSVDDELYYSVETRAQVIADHVNDLGLITLYDLDLPAGYGNTPPPPPPAPAPADGSLLLDWNFAYPAADATYDCSYAGVGWVDLTVRDDFDLAVFSELIPCVQGPVAVDHLAPGRYSVEMVGVGDYAGQAIDLYLGSAYAVDIYGDLETDIGVQVLDRMDLNFGDFLLDWSFAGFDCYSEGVDEVTLRIVRATDGLVDDELQVSCDASPLLRETFVPGLYDVEVEAFDSYGDCWFGMASADLEPGSLIDMLIDTDLVRCN